MINFATARRRMVDNQLRTADITRRDVLAAFERVPREVFLPGALQPFAYTDGQLDVGSLTRAGAPRCLVPPVLLARLIQPLGIVPGTKVLHVGAATGYGSAVLAVLGATVVAIEEDAEIAAGAEAALAAAGYAAVRLLCAPLDRGSPEHAPYDAILIEGAYEEHPSTLLGQLAEAGRLIGIEGAGRAGEAKLFTRSGETATARVLFDASAPMLAPFRRTPAFTF